MRRAKIACAADDSLIKQPKEGKCFLTVRRALASVVLWFLLGLGLTPGNLGKRDPLAGGGGAPTCIPNKVHMAYRRGNGRPQNADRRLQAGVRAGYV